MKRHVVQISAGFDDEIETAFCNREKAKIFALENIEECFFKCPRIIEQEKTVEIIEGTRFESWEDVSTFEYDGDGFTDITAH